MATSFTIKTSKCQAVKNGKKLVSVLIPGFIATLPWALVLARYIRGGGGVAYLMSSVAGEFRLGLNDFWDLALEPTRQDTIEKN
jgi:hypothetical protein